jgi:hypothetical protein
MLLHLSPSNWFFIFMALLLSSYLKIASAKTQKPVFFAAASTSVSRLLSSDR